MSLLKLTVNFLTRFKTRRSLQFIDNLNKSAIWHYRTWVFKIVIFSKFLDYSYQICFNLSAGRTEVRNSLFSAL